MHATNQINLHLVPVKPGKEKDYFVEPVSIAPEDMGIYVCQAAIARGHSTSANQAREEVDINDVLEVVKLL